MALRIGTQWFASTSLGTSSVGTTADFDSTAGQLSLNDFTLSNWTRINFTAGSTLGLGTGVDTNLELPDGDVTAFGVYRTGGVVSRFDSFVISIPEPSGAMLLGATGFLVLLRRRR